jgi:hypothetical protein
MQRQLLTSAAVMVLVTGTSFALAQGTGATREVPSAGATTQQNMQSPSSQHGTAVSPGTAKDQSEKSSESKRSSDPEMKSTQSDEKMQRGKDQNQSAQERKASDKMKDQKSAQEHMKGEKSKNTENDRAMDDAKSPERKSQTTGQAGASAKLSTEQRTEITNVIREQKIQPETNINFSVSVGTRVPQTVHFHPLPATIVSIYPDWRGYEFFLVRDQIIVVNPRTFEIVAILET